MDNNIGILTEQAGFAREGIRYFVIDSELKTDADKEKNLEDLADSGFAPLMKFLNDDLKKRKDLNIVSVGLRRARGKFEILKAESQRKRSIIAADTAEKRENLAAENLAAAAALNGWASTTCPALLNEFQESLSADIADSRAGLEIELKPGGKISDRIALKLETAIKNASLDAQQLCELAPLLLQDARSAASECLIGQLKKLERQVSNLLQALATKAGAQIAERLMLDKPVKTFSNTGEVVLPAQRDDHSLFTTVRSAALGAGVAFGAMNILNAIGIGSMLTLLPVIGPILALPAFGIVAVLWGAKTALDLQRGQQRNLIQQQVMGAIPKELGNVLVLAGVEFSKASQVIQSRAREAIQEIITQGQRRLTESKRDIQARGKVDSETLQREEKIVEALEKDIAEIGSQLSATEATVRA